MTPTIHLVTGSTGAGKTTYARKLADDAGALRFSIDEWMVALYGPDVPEPIQFEWMMERIDRCEAVIWQTAIAAAQRGVCSILDLGLTKKAHRAKFAAAAQGAGLPVVLHYIDLSVDERWARVQKRNVEKGSTYRLDVTRQMFDFIERMWECPDETEMAALNGRRV